MEVFCHCLLNHLSQKLKIYYWVVIDLGAFCLTMTISGGVLPLLLWGSYGKSLGEWKNYLLLPRQESKKYAKKLIALKCVWGGSKAPNKGFLYLQLGIGMTGSTKTILDVTASSWLLWACHSILKTVTNTVSIQSWLCSQYSGQRCSCSLLCTNIHSCLGAWKETGISAIMCALHSIFKWHHHI